MIQAAKIVSRTDPSAAIEGSEGERSTLKAYFHEISSPSSRCRLISYRPTATKGPTSAKPEASGKSNCQSVLI